MYIFTCYKCKKQINLWNGDAYRTEIVNKNGEWIEVQIHASPSCNQSSKKRFVVIQGDKR